MKINHLALAGVVLAVGAGSMASAQESADKSGYHLFNPTPRALMRELSTDRPDTTESPNTVDAGHFQAEISFVEYGYDDEDGVRTDEWVVMPSNLKVGLLNNVDLQFVIDPYVNVRTKADDAGSDRVDGFGNIQLRLKINLWGNEDGSPTAMALMPFVQFPTADDEFGETDHVTGGLIVPFKAELPAGFSLGLMGEIDIVRDDEDDDYAVELMHTAILGHDIVGDLAGYVEYIGIAPVDTGGGYQALASAGLTYGLGENAQLDGGVVVGISDSAEDVRFFVGLSVRH